MKRPAPHRPAADRNRLAFTLIELLTVISIIGVLAGMVVGLAPVASARMKEARVRGELAGLVTAIESYKAKFGVYPPDHTYKATFPGVGEVTAVNPVVNTLYYELTGALVDNQVGSERFFSAVDDSVLKADKFYELTGREGLVNAIPRSDTGPLSASDRQLMRRLFNAAFKEGQIASVYRVTNNGYPNFRVLAVGHSGDMSGKKGSGISWPLNIPAAAHPIPANPGLNPWRYVSTNPTNNPSSFDLWAEIIVKGERRIIGNWKN